MIQYIRIAFYHIEIYKIVMSIARAIKEIKELELLNVYPVFRSRVEDYVYR